MKYYHGTNYDSGLNIMKNGFEHNTTIWNCSNKNLTYLISEEYDDGPYTSDKPEPNDIPAFRFATGAAQIAAANSNQLTDQLFVFEFDINENIPLDEDISCSNMYDCYQIDNKTLNEHIINGDIKINIYLLNKAYVPYLRIFYLKDLSTEFYTPNNQDLQTIIEQMKNIETCWFYDDYMSYFDSYKIIDHRDITLLRKE